MLKRTIVIKIHITNYLKKYILGTLAGKIYTYLQCKRWM